MLIKLVGKLIPKYLRVFIRNSYILAIEYGQLKTIKRWECLDKNDDPIPWYTYPAIEYLSTIDFSDMSIFEYGGGNSTLWWASRAKMVVTVENDPDWYSKIQSKIKENIKIELYLKTTKEDYVNFLLERSENFDVIVIDGRWRSDCAKILSKKLNKRDGFLIILDNSDWYPKTKRFLIESFDLIPIDFHGFGPINGYTWTTTVLVSRTLRLHFKESLYYSKGAIKQLAEDDCI